MADIKFDNPNFNKEKYGKYFDDNGKIKDIKGWMNEKNKDLKSSSDTADLVNKINNKTYNSSKFEPIDPEYAEEMKNEALKFYKNYHPRIFKDKRFTKLSPEDRANILTDFVLAKSDMGVDLGDLVTDNPKANIDDYYDDKYSREDIERLALDQILNEASPESNITNGQYWKSADEDMSFLYDALLNDLTADGDDGYTVDELRNMNNDFYTELAHAFDDSSPNKN